VNHAGKPPWERLVFCLVAAAIGLQVLAEALPRLLPSLVILAVTVAVIRIVWFYTNRY
jgi:hypothetical protein